MAGVDLAHMNIPGSVLDVRATPKAARDRVTFENDIIRIYVTAPPDKGKANAAVQKLLAKAIGCAKTDLTLIRGATNRNKQFKLRS